MPITFQYSTLKLVLSPLSFYSNAMILPLQTKLVAPNGLEINQPLSLFINNEFIPSKSNETLSVVDPSTAKADY